MFNFSGPAIAFFVGAMALMLLLSLVLSFRETTREIREFFDLAMIRRLLCCRFSMRTLLIFAALLPPVVVYVAAYWRNADLSDLIVVLMAASYLLVIVVPLLIVFLKDAFGPSSRQYWEDRRKDRD